MRRIWKRSPREPITSKTSWDDKTRGVVGILKDVLDHGAQNLFVIKKENGGELLVPAVEEFFTGVDFERKTVLVDLIEGMYED